MGCIRKILIIILEREIRCHLGQGGLNATRGHDKFTSGVSVTPYTYVHTDRCKVNLLLV